MLTIKAGDKFGKLTIIKEVERFVQPSGQFQRGFLCKCECGKEKRIRLSHLKHNRVISCGCEVGDLHGESGSLLHNVWRGMMNRCNTDTYIDKHRYKDRGITVCDIWKRYIPFRDWAISSGWKHGLQIDRIDNDKGYSPDNCRFVEPHINVNNRECTIRVSYYGQVIPISELLRSKGINMVHMTSIRSRISRGWSVENAIDTPMRKGNYGKKLNKID